MCGPTKKPCPECGGTVVWFCGDEGGVGAIECRDCKKEFNVERYCLKIVTEEIEEDRKDSKLEWF